MEESLIDKLKAAFLASRKARNQMEIKLYSTLIGEAEAIGKKSQRPPNNEEVLGVIKATIKNLEFLKSSMAEHHQSGSGWGQFDEAQASIKILETYLPIQMDAREIETTLEHWFLSEPSQNVNKGAMMKYLKQNFAGRYDGAVASGIAETVVNHIIDFRMSKNIEAVDEQ